MMRHTSIVILFGAALAGGAGAQQCDDFDPCTVDDTCFAGSCNGTVTEGVGCDDNNGCTIDDRCQPDALGGVICRGVAAPPGTACGGGCGTCQPIIGSPHLMLCGGAPEDNGKACDFAGLPCVDGTCYIFEGRATCLPRARECPDTDGNPCTDNCDFATDSCRPDAPKCVPTCERCDPGTGLCEPDHLFEACDDGDVCSTLTRCEFNESARRTFCVAGLPIGPSPTRTVMASTPTVPPTATRSSTPTPSAARTATASAVPTRSTSPTRSPTPPPTAPRTSTVPATPARTASLTPTPPLAASPTAILSPPPCTGDCDGNRAVMINELLVGINIALGRRASDACEALDSDASGAVEIHELLAAVRAVLVGCP